MNTIITKIYVGPTAPTMVKDVLWIDTENEEIKVFGPSGWVSYGGGGGGLIEPGIPGNIPIINEDGVTLVDGAISHEELASLIELVGSWDEETVQMVKNASTLKYFLNLIIGYDEMPEFDSEAYYANGDLVLKDAILYRFIAPHHGVWSDEDVTDTNFYKEFVRYYSGAAEEENVSVQLNFDEETPSFEGKYITTVVGGVEYQHEISATGLSQFTIGKHTQYTIKFPVFTGYGLITDRVYTAYLAQRSVDMTYLSTGAAITDENVKVKTSFTNSTTQFPSGDITVKDNTDNTTATYTLDSAGECSFTIPLGHSYTITFPSNTGYITTVAKTFTASLINRIILSKYAPVNSGIFYMDANLNQYTYNEWVEAGKLGTEAKYMYFSSSTLSANGANFFINLDDLRATIPSKKWLSEQVTVDTLPLLGTKALAVEDYGVIPFDPDIPGSGPISNMLYLKSWIDDKAQEGYSYSSELYNYAITKDLTINGSTYKAYIGTAGQWEFLSTEQNYNMFNQMINYLHQSDATLPSDLGWTSKTFWTMTQYSSAYSWYLLNGSLNNGGLKTNSYLALCFYAL